MSEINYKMQNMEEEYKKKMADLEATLSGKNNEIEYELAQTQRSY